MIADGGFIVQVGKDPQNRQAVRIPEAAMKANTVLRKQLSQGAVIFNSDATSLEAALHYIRQSGLFGKLQLNPRNSFEKLVTGSDMMSKLAKAWHLAQMLELPHMQNKLIDIFSARYQHLIQSNARLPLSPEPFEYLRTHTGYYTKCEKFIVEFHAGLASHGESLHSEELARLPRDIALELQNLCEKMAASTKPHDRIDQGSKLFGVSSADMTWKAALRVVHPRGLPSKTKSSPSLKSTESPTTTPPAQSSPSRQRPFFSFLSGLRRAAGNYILQPPSHPPMDYSPKHSQNTAAPTLHMRPPFWPAPPLHRRSWAEMEAEESSEDSDSVYDLFSSTSRWRNDSQQGVREEGVKWVW
jgi:hypothetical protein